MKCKFCAFAVTQKEAGAYTYTGEELVEDALRQRELTGFTEIHMVGGESPHVDFGYYVEIVSKLHHAMPDVHLKLFTASEIHHMSKLAGITHEAVLRELKAAGLGSLPGGGAEVFADRVRRLVAPGKEHPDEWFDVHRHARTRSASRRTARCSTGTWRRTRSASTTCCGCARSRTRRAASSRSCRSPSTPRTPSSRRRGWRHTTGADDLKVIAVSRLLLDNVPNIKAYWIMMGLPLAQVALHFGANDVQGTVVREEIFQAAGATAGTEQKLEELARFIREAGRVPVQRDTLYNELEALRLMLRLGRISYVNMAPVFFRLEAEIEEIAGVPTELNARLLAGELDVAPISSIEYAGTPTGCACCRDFASRPKAPWTRSSSSRASRSSRCAPSR